MKRLVAVAVAVAAIAATTKAHACAGCRNPGLPITRLSSAQLTPGEVRASALLTATALNVVHEAGCSSPDDCIEQPTQPRHLHDQDVWPGELRAVAELGLTPSWGIEAQVPFRVTRTRIRYTTPDGAPYVPLDRDVHHRNETLAGLGDPWLLGRFATTAGELLVTVRAGITVPLGRTEEDPFALGEAGQPHQHIQMGNGTFDPVIGLDLSRTIGAVQLGGYGQAQLTLYENDEGFRAGHRLFGGLQAGTRIVARLVGALTLEALHEGAERWQGVVQQDGNLGRTELLAGLSLTQPLGRTLLSVAVRVPVYRRLAESGDAPARLSSPLMLSLVATRTF